MTACIGFCLTSGCEEKCRNSSGKAHRCDCGLHVAATIPGKAGPGGEVSYAAFEATCRQHVEVADRLRASLAAVTAANEAGTELLTKAEKALAAVTAERDEARAASVHWHEAETAASARAEKAEAALARIESWSGAPDALRVLGEALYPGLDGDAPKGTPNTAWAFAHEIVRRYNDVQAALAASVKREDVVRWLELTAKELGDDRGYLASAVGDIAAMLTDIDGGEGIWRKDLERLTTMDAGTAEARCKPWCGRVLTEEVAATMNKADDVFAVPDGSRGAVVRVCLAIRGDTVLCSRACLDRWRAARPADKEDGNG